MKTRVLSSHPQYTRPAALFPLQAAQLESIRLTCPFSVRSLCALFPVQRLAAVLGRRQAGHSPECGGELAGVVIADLPGDVEHRPVGLQQQPGRFFHPAAAQVSADRHPVHRAEAPLRRALS